MDLEIAAGAGAALMAQSFLADAGSSAWEGAVRLLNAMRTKIAGNAPAELSLRQVEQNPQSQDAVDSLAVWIASSMREDADFLSEITSLIREAESGSAAPVVARTYNNYQGAEIGKVVSIETVTGDLNF